MWRSLRLERAFADSSPRLCRGFDVDVVVTGSNPRRSRVLTALVPKLSQNERGAFTLVEMLVAMAITLVMMAAVVTLFANISGSVRNRRATAEMSGQLRHVRNVLQQDLQGATCPGQTWQRPESNHGYIELIEGQYRDSFPSMLTDGKPHSDGSTSDLDGDGQPDPDEIDLATSIIPGANDGSLVQMNGSNVTSTVSGLGDYDDIFMLTTRNEHEPFAGRGPANVRGSSGAHRFNVSDTVVGWDIETITSPLAEVIWFAIENPPESENPKNSFGEPFFGEPGMRTIYRRALLIVPHVNLYRGIGTRGQPSDTFQYEGELFKAEPGLLRLLPGDVELEDVETAIAAIIAFQDRYDISARLEWDHNITRWKIVANTLGDLTKRENRYGHFGLFPGTGGNNPSKRIYPYPLVSYGSGYQGSQPDLAFAPDPEVPPSGPPAKAVANLSVAPLAGLAVSYSIDPGNLNTPSRYDTRPFAYIVTAPTGVPSTAQAMLNDEGRVIRVVHGPVPLWGARRGQDVMMTSALAFDVRIYDPGAPLFGMRDVPGDVSSRINLVLSPSDAGYTAAYLHADNTGPNGIGSGATAFPFVGQGAYVDMGYGLSMQLNPPQMMNAPKFAGSAAMPWFFVPRALSDVLGNQLAPGYAVYDTWSFHYENNGVNEDSDEVELVSGAPTWQIDNNNGMGMPSIDEATNGLEDFGHYQNAGTTTIDNVTRLGVDDVGERETAPPYDRPLRGVQVLMRVYEPDSRAIRQVRVNQHFMQE
jgi:prepilin-type N-terminal cleavage/methylation domain-containing protein